jgi:hypothetical protein
LTLNVSDYQSGKAPKEKRKKGEISMKKVSVAVAVIAGLGLTLGVPGGPGGARADTYVQNSDHCSATCGISTGNTVTVTGTTTLDIKVQLASGWSFVQTGAHQSFDFSLNGISPVTGVINPLTSDSAHWAFLNAVGTTVTGAASIMDDGLTIPQFAYALNHTTSGNNVDGSFLEFTISATGLTTGSFNQLLLTGGGLSGSFFAADVLSATGATGVIDFALVPVPGPIVGAGLPGLVMAFGGLLALARRRRRQQFA